MKATESSPTNLKEPDDRARSSSPSSGDNASRNDGLSASAKRAYFEEFAPPALFDHPEHDGFRFGRKLAKRYPERMMQVMEGFRQGVKAGTEAAQRAGGQTR
ncbi:hypothetical protein GGQ11_003328 [Salinibacter ruber]|uniref:hypothetical protein n=1 Tax=Salinibacter ruber TaxID=146919 RepID=UPI00216A2DEC|nr:hypothetical protein [Salinibacter ruber]MCS3658522.1 hypothetical protein [Salinibacter ruber]